MSCNIPFSSDREDLARLIDNAGKAVETACVSKKNAHLKATALTNFLINAYNIRIHHELDDVRGRKTTLIARCLDNIHKALRMLTPEELSRVHELSFSTPEDLMPLWQVIRIGKKISQLLHLNDIDEYADIDPGFYTSPETIVRDIRTYFRKSRM